MANPGTVYIKNASTSAVLYVVLNSGPGPYKIGPRERVGLPAGQSITQSLLSDPLYCELYPDANYQYPGNIPFWMGLVKVGSVVEVHADPGPPAVLISDEPNAVGKSIRARPSQLMLTDAQKAAYVGAVNTLNASGEYGKLAAFHGEAVHDMHGGMGQWGIQRFLVWHRIYLCEFEKLLRTVDPSITLPYWDWTADPVIPAWLEAFQPNVKMPSGNDIQVIRRAGWPKPLPTDANITGVWANTDFTSFTSKTPDIPGAGGGLEGIHNSVHDWFDNSTMNNVPIASADPIFWMHHANIDRIWTLWQYSNRAQFPNLAPNTLDDEGQPANVMDPWTFSEVDARDTIGLGYTYAWSPYRGGNS
jgi:tyrosinase